MSVKETFQVFGHDLTHTYNTFDLIGAAPGYENHDKLGMIERAHDEGKDLKISEASKCHALVLSAVFSKAEGGQGLVQKDEIHLSSGRVVTPQDIKITVSM